MYFDHDDRYPNRTLCDVLADMRRCHKTHNYAAIRGLIEEVQILGNKMEAGLGDKSDVEERTKRLRELKQEIKQLKEIKTKLDEETKKEEK